MSKAERIIKLRARGWGTSQVAKHVDCSPEYVRAVMARHKNGGKSPADIKYEPVKRVRTVQRLKERLATDPEFYRRYYDYQAEYRRNRKAIDPEFAERLRGYRTASRKRKAERQAA